MKHAQNMNIQRMAIFKQVRPRPRGQSAETGQRSSAGLPRQVLPARAQAHRLIPRAMRDAALLLSLVLLVACSGVKPDASSAPAPASFKVDPATAGTIKGKVEFVGKSLPPKIVAMASDPQCAKLHARPLSDAAIAVNNNALANVFVYIKQGLDEKKFASPTDPVVIDQKGCWFGPRVLGVQVGQTLKVTNSDPVTHNIHPLAQINREWNQSQEPGAEALTRKFTQPEVMIRVKCNIHGWMHAWVGVVAHPYFAVTGADGSFQLPNVPPGNYVIETWHEELGKQEQPLTLSSSGTSELVFKYKGE
jgi:plastocyanin